jgi:hypothetical protein
VKDEPDVSLNKSYILNNCNNAIIYDSTPAYLKPPLQIRVPHLHKATIVVSIVIGIVEMLLLVTVLSIPDSTRICICVG